MAAAAARANEAEKAAKERIAASSEKSAATDTAAARAKATAVEKARIYSFSIIYRLLSVSTHCLFGFLFVLFSDSN